MPILSKAINCSSHDGEQDQEQEQTLVTANPCRIRINHRPFPKKPLQSSTFFWPTIENQDNMSAPLYARYVPPKKYQAPIQPLAPQETTYKAIHNSTPQLYSRYVPPKGSKHSSEALATSLQPFDISLKTNSIPTTTEDANLHSKKRKREEQSNTHKDRRALIEASSTEHNEDEGATSRQNDPGIKEKKSKKRKSSKAEAVVAPLGHEGEQGQPEGGSPADADSILAKYSVTGGNHRVSLLRSREGRNKANSYDHMDIDPLDNEDEMSVGSADEAREEEEEEE